MFEPPPSRHDRAIALVAAGIDALLGLDPDVLTDEELRALVGVLERQSRRMPAVMHRLVAAVEQRRLGQRLGLRDTAGLLRRDLQLAAGDARARARAADLLGPRVSEAGAQLAPALPATAEAQSSGHLSAAHARVIQSAVEQIPPGLSAGSAAELESRSVDDARRLSPTRLAQRASRLLAELDPGHLGRQEAEQERRRGASFMLNPDGSADLRAHLTPVGAALVQAALMPLAAPRPDDAAGQDQRTAPQRLHDGLVEACRRLLVAKDVPGEGGVPATVIITVPLTELESRVGIATTQYGGSLSIHQLLRVAGEARLIPVVVDEHQAPLHVGRSKRFATKEQTYALIARDRGCSFPDCDHPPPWTQRHHIRSWLDDGWTDILNLTLLCVYHHANFERLGWECVMIDGIVFWRPPDSVDPAQRLIRNTAHDRPGVSSVGSPVAGGTERPIAGEAA